MEQPRGKLGTLSETQFRLLFLGRTSSAVGDSLVPVALAFAVLSVSATAQALGAVLAVFTVTRVSLSLVGGVYADRLPRRTIMVACDVVRAAVEAFTAAMLLTGNMTLGLFFVTAGIFGAASAFFAPASTGLVPQTVPPERLQSANALLGMSQSAVNVFGPLLSGLLVVGVGTGWVFAVDSVTFVASALFLARLRVSRVAAPAATRFAVELARGLREVRTRAWVWLPLVSFSVTNLCFAAFLVLGPIVARDDLGGAREWGIIGTGGAIGAVAGGALALRVRPSRPLAAGFSAWTLCALPLLALAPPLAVPLVAAAYGVGLAGISFGTALWQTTLQARIPQDVLARVSSYDWLVSFVFMPIGFLALGPVSDAIGVGTTFVVAAVVLALTNALVAAAPAVRGVSRGAPPATAAAPAIAKQRAA